MYIGIRNIYIILNAFRDQYIVHLRNIRYYPETILRILSVPKLMRDLTENQRNYIIIIGRGHSGTRAPAMILHEAGVFMGDKLNKSYDYAHRYYRHFLYKAARMAGANVIYKGNYEWDLTGLIENPIPKRMICYLMIYLRDIIVAPYKIKGWKIPETTLLYPWLTRLMPEAKYIFWARHPLDSILGPHITDRLKNWDIEVDEIDDAMKERAVSWKYQWDIVNKSPKPQNFLEIRFEDFLSDQREVLQRMEEFVGMSLKGIPVDKSRMHIFKQHNLSGETYPFLKEVLMEYEHLGQLQGRNLRPPYL
jgi:hypothetical protein